MREEMRTSSLQDLLAALSDIACVCPRQCQLCPKARKDWHGARHTKRACAVAVSSHQRRALPRNEIWVLSLAGLTNIIVVLWSF